MERDEARVGAHVTWADPEVHELGTIAELIHGEVKVRWDENPDWPEFVLMSYLRLLPDVAP